MARGQSIAVILYNLGGPDGPDAVRPFLFNLFRDPAIIGLPAFLRWPLAAFIAVRRAKAARHIYAQMGGRSPILPVTERQAGALEHALNAPGSGGAKYRVFVAMRYWKPFAEHVITALETLEDSGEFEPDEIVLLPLYPQFSSTTTASFAAHWRRCQENSWISAPVRSICCYPRHPSFVAAHADLIRPAYAEAARHGSPRILFSAHGLPERTVNKGDPYPWQVGQTAGAIVRALGIPDLDWKICYQSRVGRLTWIEPYTDAEIRRAGGEKAPLVIVPLAFVSEHSETLVELDIEYRKLAEESGVPAYVRVPALGTHPRFIEALADLCREARPPRICPDSPQCRLCPA